MANLQQLKESIYQSLSSYQKDFVDNYDATCTSYVCDALHEFADNNTSIYYCDQRKYYLEHSEDCDNALLEYGYDLNQLLKEGDSLEDIICKAGAIGEYNSIYCEVNNNLEDCLKVLILDYAIQNELDPEKVEEVINNFSECDIDRFDDIKDILMEAC